MTIATRTTLGFSRKIALGLTFSTLVACAPSVVSPGADSGGSGPGSGGSSTGSTGGVTGSGGTPSGTGGAGTGGAGTGGAVAGTGGAGTGGAGTGGRGTGGMTAATGGANAGGGGAAGGSSAGGGGACNGVLCDSFERATLGADWTVDNSVAANVVEVVTDKAHTGTNSVHMRIGTTATATFIDETMGFPAMNNSYWGRVWLFVMTGLEAGHHVYIEGSTGVNPGNTGVRALNTQGNGLIATNIAPPDTGGTSTVAMPQGMWTCFEWQVTATAGTGGVHLFMNSTEVPGTVALNRPIPNLIKQRIGYERYSAGTAGELWIDDYAIGPARIGCN